MRAAWLFLVAGCASMQVQYPGGKARPGVLATQIYTSSAYSQREGRNVRRYQESMLIEAGCALAARSAGVDLTILHGKATVETDADVSYVHGSVDAARVAHESGAEAVLTGTARLSKRLAVEKLRLEVRSAQNQLLAVGESASDDGLEPMQAGQQLCAELFRGWGPAPSKTTAPPPTPRSLYIVGVPKSDRGIRFRQGCERAAQEVGVAVVAPAPLLPGPGTRWQRWSASTGADGFLVADAAFPTAQPEGVSAAHVWLTDARGVVMATRLYRVQGATIGEPGLVGHELCRSLLSPP